MLIEFLTNVCCRLFEDFSGVLTEDVLRNNMLMIYEILDEVIDYGYIQTTSTEGLRVFVMSEFSDTEGIKKNASSGSLVSSINSRFSSLGSALVSKKTIDSSVTNTSIQDTSKKRNDLFIDVLERVNAILDSSGTPIRADIVGSISMKSFLIGQPSIRFGLNEDLVIGTSTGGYGYGNGVRIDSCSFSDLVRTNEFQQSRILSLVPPHGSFNVMNYRLANVRNLPFKVYPYVTVGGSSSMGSGLSSTSSFVSDYKVEVVIKIQAIFDKKFHASKVLVNIPVPQDTSSASVEFGVGSQTAYEYKAHERLIIWGISKFMGGTEQVIRIKITLNEKPKYDIKKQIGPITMKFEMPLYNISGLQIRFLKFEDVGTGSDGPSRWVRYICKSDDTNEGGNYEIRMS